MKDRPIFKGPGHRGYARRMKDLEYIFTNEFPNWSPDSGNKIARETGIPKSTLYSWRQHWIKNRCWRPTNSAHGVHRRIFTDEEEQTVSEYIFSNFLLVNRAFTNQDFKDLIMQAFLEKHKDGPVPEFSVSQGFIEDFKRRNFFSTRRAHPKKRPKRDPAKEELFLQRVKEIFDTVDHDRILNVDETFWSCAPMDLTTWGRRGDEQVDVQLDAKEKEGLTVLACVTASCLILPLWLIAKGKTDACHEQLGDPQGHLVAHSESGWTTVETFSQFLMSVRERFADDDPIYLLLDLYSVHRSDEIKELAENLGIHLVFIPPGMTDHYQPLDRRVFGVLKQYMRLLWRKEYMTDPLQRFSKRKAVQLLVPAWERISPQIIRSGWSVFFDEDDDD